MAVPAAALLLAAGCRSDRPAARRVSAAGGPAIGAPVLAVIHACSGRRVQVFDMQGHACEVVRDGRPGSVSIYTPDEAGQDNYTFDANGIVTRHLRSHGTNFNAGVWVAAP